MHLQQGVVRLSREAVWFTSVYTSLRETLIVVQGGIIRKKWDIIGYIFTCLMVFCLYKSLRSSVGSQELLSSGLGVSVSISLACKPQDFILEFWTQADRPFAFTAVEVTRTS